MIFKETKLPGVFEMELELKQDERGYFARAFGEDELQKQNIEFHIRQINRSFNAKKGTVRGMHYQKSPHWEDKILTCLSGSVYIIVADLRRDSPVYKQWVSLELSARKKNMVLIPKGCANGMQTLEDGTEILYYMSEFYSPEAANGFNIEDNQFKFTWPLAISVISEKDKALPIYAD